MQPNDGYPTWKPVETDFADSAVSIPNYGATTLSRAQLEDKIKGALFGQALGDAMGLATEFMTKPEAERHYGGIVASKGYIPFENFVKDDHRTWWDEGDWTDDTGTCIPQGVGCQSARRFLTRRTLQIK